MTTLRISFFPVPAIKGISFPKAETRR